MAAVQPAEQSSACPTVNAYVSFMLTAKYNTLLPGQIQTHQHAEEMARIGHEYPEPLRWTGERWRQDVKLSSAPQDHSPHHLPFFPLPQLTWDRGQLARPVGGRGLPGETPGQH